MRPALTLRREHIEAIRASRSEDRRLRLVVFLRTRHPSLCEGLDVPEIVARGDRIAEEQGILEDEGIAWLCAIFLAGAHAGASLDWASDWLAARQGPEEDRLRAVHDEAARRGIFGGAS